MFKEAMGHLSSGAKALICIQENLKRIVAEEIRSLFGEERKPLIYFGYHDTELNDRMEDIEEWVTNPSSFKGRHLIADLDAVQGFEADQIIGIGEDALKDYISRARVNFIHINDNLPESLCGAVVISSQSQLVMNFAAGFTSFFDKGKTFRPKK